MRARAEAAIVTIVSASLSAGHDQNTVTFGYDADGLPFGAAVSTARGE
jgi:hypothetical protein